MKGFRIISVILVSLLTLGLLFVSCDMLGSLFGEDEDPVVYEDLSFTGKSGDKTVTITISRPKSSKAVLDPKSGDSYTIELGDEIISEGTITITDSKWVFKPSEDSPGDKTEFNATYSNSNETLIFESTTNANISGLTATKDGTTNEKPALTGTVTITGTAKVGQTLTVNTSALGGSGTISYQWKRGSGSTAIGTASTYTVVSADTGSTITVTVTRAGNSGSVTSQPTATVVASPTLTGTVTITGTAKVGETLTADTADLGGSGTISYQWKRGDTDIGTDSSTYTVVSADVNSTITVTVTRSGYSGSVTSVATATVGGSSLPALTGAVTITGTAQVSQILTANTANLDGTGTISYQWKRGGTDITGANSSTYTVQQADVNSTITVTVTRSGYSGSVSGSVFVPPVLTGTVAITINDTFKEGVTLGVNITNLYGDGTISYQWKREGTDITGAKSSTYELTSSDIGSTITVTVTRIGYLGSVTSYGIGSSGDFTFTETATGVTITGYTGSGGSITIPDVLKEKAVTEIGKEAFYYKGTITSVKIPNSVTSIGTKAFGYNETITSVEIGENVRTIGSEAFVANKLTSVNIPSSVESIGERAFNSNLLDRITIPDSVTSIGKAAFAYNQLTSVTMNKTITSIVEGLFANNQLTSVTIPDGVISIKASAFDVNPLSRVIISDSVESIERDAFDWNKLISVTIGKEVTIGYAVFVSSFETAYNNANKAAGTYTRLDTDTAWAKQP